MAILAKIWNLVFKQPILISLTWFAQLTGNLGLAVVLLTLVIQLVLTPLRLPSLKSAQKMKKLKPELDKLKQKHADDKMALAEAQMELFKEHGVSPMGGILPTLLSIPVIIALYRVLLSSLGSFGDVSTTFLWLDVAEPDPLFIIPAGVFVVQYILMNHRISDTKEEKTAQAKQSASQKEESSSDSEDLSDIMQGVQSQMKYIFPAMSALITLGLPSGVGLYWLVSLLFAIMQQKLVETDGS